METLSLASFETGRIGCPEIITALGISNGDLVQGFVHIFRLPDDISVEATYSYTIKDSFKTGEIFVFNPFQYYDAPIYEVAAGGAGAGGLGVGASIDVVKIEPRNISR